MKFKINPNHKPHSLNCAAFNELHTPTSQHLPTDYKLAQADKTPPVPIDYKQTLERDG